MPNDLELGRGEGLGGFAAESEECVVVLCVQRSRTAGLGGGSHGVVCLGREFGALVTCSWFVM